MRKYYLILKNVTPENYIFWSTIFFLLTIWFFNFSNKIIAGSFLILIIFYYYKIKDLKLSVLFTYLASSLIFTGKNYPQQIVPPGILPVEIYPQGFFVNFTVTPSLLMLTLLAVLLFREFFTGKFPKLNTKPVDILILLFFMWPVFSDIVASKDPNLSLLFSITGAGILIFYFFVKYFAARVKNFDKYLVALFSALIIFESLVSVQQLIAKSPLGKNLEHQVNIEYFGNAGDEIAFAFRPLGTFPHANALGVWLSASLMFLIFSFLTKPSQIKAVTFFLGFAILTATLSRSSWLGFLIAILVCLLISEKMYKIKFHHHVYKYMRSFIFVVPVLAIFFVIPRLEKSVNTFSAGGGYFREVQTRRALETIESHFFFGVGTNRSVQEGLNSFDPRDPDTSIVQNIHNWYLLGIVEHGIPYLAIFILIIMFYIKMYIQNLIGKGISIINFNDIIQLGLFGGVISSLIAGFFQPFVNLQIIILAIALFKTNKKE